MSPGLRRWAKKKVREITPIADKWPAHNKLDIIKYELIVEDIAVGQKGEQEYQRQAKDTVSRQWVHIFIQSVFHEILR
jgi:hypothetical protein